MTVSSRPIGATKFVDGVTRTVYEDDEDEGRRQFVIDDETGEPIYGVWLHIAEPEIVARPADQRGRDDIDR